MVEKINVKTVAIVAIIAVILCIAIFFVVSACNDKSYTLEKIEESDYQYFAVYTGEKYGVINTEGDMVVENVYTDVVIPNPTKAVFFVTDEMRKYKGIK